MDNKKIAEAIRQAIDNNSSNVEALLKIVDELDPQTPKPGTKPEPKRMAGEIYSNMFPAIWTGTEWLYCDGSTNTDAHVHRSNDPTEDLALLVKLRRVSYEPYLVTFVREYLASLDDNEIRLIMDKMKDETLVSAYRTWAKNKFAAKTPKMKRRNNFPQKETKWD